MNDYIYLWTVLNLQTIIVTVNITSTTVVSVHELTVIVFIIPIVWLTQLIEYIEV